MTTILDQDPSATPERLPLERSDTIPTLGRVALSGIGISAGHFYGANEQFIGKIPGGEHRVIIGSTSKAGVSKNEVVGVGEDVESALYDSLERMRTLETVRTRSLAHIEMTDSSFASYTSLEHYNPKVAPSAVVYPIPEYLEDTLTDHKSGDETYRNTVEKEGWQTELRTIVADYLQNDAGGQKLVESLKIRSLSHLTPEQAVKLSAAFVQNVSTYSHEDASSRFLTRADKSTAAELLKEGIANKKDPSWKGNGVCRNIASNVKSVFEALKATQAELSMLNNTYAVYGAGFGGEGYADSREERLPGEIRMPRKDGHAWNTFVTTDENGSAVATIIDATWALDTDAESATKHLDRTEIRAAGQLMKLFKKSEVKSEAFGGLTEYTRGLLLSTSTNRELGQSGRDGICENITTEYLKMAALVPEISEDFNLPDAIVISAYRMRKKLEHNELETLLTLDKASGDLRQDRIKLIIASYDDVNKELIPKWQKAENLVFADDDAQELVFEVVGEDRAKELAEHDGGLRARLREMRPELLPPFNPTERTIDAYELSYFAVLDNIHSKDPAKIMRRFHDRLKKCVDDESIYEAIIAGRSDYDIAKNFSGIIKALNGRTKS